MQEFEIEFSLDPQEFEIDISDKIIEVAPPLIDLEITPTAEEQIFKHEGQYGYDNVKVNAIQTENLDITPGTEDYNFEGIYNKVKVDGDENLKAENIRQGTSIFGVEGTMEGAWDTSLMRSCQSMFYDNKTMEEAPYFNTENVTTMENMLYQCNRLKKCAKYNTKNVKTFIGMHRYNTDIEEIPEYDTSKGESFQYMIYMCTKIKSIPQFDTSNGKYFTEFCYANNVLESVPLLDFSKAWSAQNAFAGNRKLKHFGGAKNLGKGFYGKSNNYQYHTFNIKDSKLLTPESVMNIFNNLYDLNVTYSTVGDGTLYTQQLIIGPDNIAKVDPSVIAEATAKGWTVS